MGLQKLPSRLIVRTKSAPAPAGHYSQAIVYGGLIYVSGSGPFDPLTHTLVGKDIESQTNQTLRNIESILKAGNSSLENVLKITVYLRDISLFDRMNRVYQRFFPNDPPARTTIQTGIAGPERLIVVDAIGFVSEHL